METKIRQCFLEKLNRLPGLKAEVVQFSDKDTDCALDGRFRLTSPVTTVEYAWGHQPRVSRASVGAVVEQLRRHQSPGAAPFLLSERIPDDVAGELRSRGIEYLDAGGNLYLNSPAAYVLISGCQPLKDEGGRTNRSLTATDLKLVYVLLRSVETTHLGYRELAQKANISLGAVKNAFDALLEGGYLERLRNKTYRIVSYERLLNRWGLGYAEALRPKLLIGRFTFAGSRSVEERFAEMQGQAVQGECLIGGEAGAALITSHLRPQQFVLHLQDNYRALITKLLLKPAAHGEVALLKQFGTDNAWQEQPSLADSLLVWAELLTESDTRLQETADLLLENQILTRANRAS